jgi:hypothetical protein
MNIIDENLPKEITQDPAYSYEQLCMILRYNFFEDLMKSDNLIFKTEVPWKEHNFLPGSSNQHSDKSEKEIDFLICKENVKALSQFLKNKRACLPFHLDFDRNKLFFNEYNSCFQNLFQNLTVYSASYSNTYFRPQKPQHDRECEKFFLSLIEDNETAKSLKILTLDDFDFHFHPRWAKIFKKQNISHIRLAKSAINTKLNSPSVKALLQNTSFKQASFFTFPESEEELDIYFDFLSSSFFPITGIKKALFYCNPPYGHFHFSGVNSVSLDNSPNLKNFADKTKNYIAFPPADRSETKSAISNIKKSLTHYSEELLDLLHSYPENKKKANYKSIVKNKS